MNEGISRRNFIGGAALGGAALALGALAGCAPQGDKPTGSEGAWDAEVDLLVCGCGGAGMACAVEAKDNGVENVLIIEKGDQIGGTTAMSQGMIAGWDTQLQKSQGVELTYDAMYANLMNNASYHLDPALTKITVENSGKTIDWLIDRVGVKFTDQIDIYYGPLQMMHNVDGAGGGFVTAFTACLDQLGVEIQKGTKLVEVLLDAEGKTEGAVVEAKGKTQRIKARAVMIATGGYAHNAELAARFDPEKAGTFGIGHPNCEGEGLVAASNAGALLSHTNDMMCVVKDYTIMSEHDGTSASANLDGFTNLPNMILVGADGKRFVDEGKKGFMSQNLNGPIFDKIHRDGMGYVWEISDEAKLQVDQLLKKSFRPEFLNRLDEIVCYKPLTKENITAIVDLLIGGLNKRLADKQLKVVLTPAAKSYVIDNGYDPLYGARPLRRFLQHTVETLVGRKMIADEVAPGSTLTVDCVAGELVVH